MTASRPALTEHLTGRELLRWYWLLSELVGFARALGIPAAGGKQALTVRLVAHLDGHPLPPPARPRRGAPQLPEPLTTATVLPSGQGCSQQLRRYLVDVVGPSFTFDAPMRDFIAHGEGQTLGAAVRHWYATRSGPAPAIGIQFELNRFLRAWHGHHPDAPRTAALAAWRTYRALPAEARPAP